MKHLLAIILVTVFATASFADDAPKKGKKAKSPKPVLKLKKLLEPVTLTEEQETSFAEAVETFSAKLTELEEKGLTKDKLKAHEEKRKEGRKSKLKGKELKTHMEKGLSEDELAMFKELDQATKTAEQTVAKMLTDEQLSSLPEKVQKRMNMLKKGGKGKGKKKKKQKKKKDAEEETTSE